FGTMGRKTSPPHHPLLQSDLYLPLGKGKTCRAYVQETRNRYKCSEGKTGRLPFSLLVRSPLLLPGLLLLHPFRSCRCSHPEGPAYLSPALWHGGIPVTRLFRLRSVPL